MYVDVYNLVDLIQNYIQQLAVNGIRKDVTLSLFDQAKYKLEQKVVCKLSMILIKNSVCRLILKLASHRLPQFANQAL